MKLRIAIWAAAGALVVALWSLYISAAAPPSHGTWLTLVYLTCPIALARQHALSFSFVLLVNAATYALVGAAVEAVGNNLKRPHAALSGSY